MNKLSIDGHLSLKLFLEAGMLRNISLNSGDSGNISRSMSMSRRQRAALPDSARELISRLTGFQPGDKYFDTCSAYVGLHLFDVNGIGGVRNKAIDHETINMRLTGLAEKFSMKGQDSKAEALRTYLRQLRRFARSFGGGDAARMIAATSEMDREEGAQNVMSSVLLMLLELSESPTALRRGENVYTVPAALKEPKEGVKSQEDLDRELWKAILKEDPLVGKHWDVGADDGDQDNGGSDFEDMDINPRAAPDAKKPQTSQEGSSDSAKDSNLSSSKPLSGLNLWMQRPGTKAPSHMSLRILQQHQYWHDDKIFSKERSSGASSLEEGFDIQRSSDLNSALYNCKDYVLALSTPVMDEIDIINEIFLLLQGLPTIIFTFKDGIATYSTKVTVSHLSPGALESTLQPFLGSAGEILELQSAVDKICSAPAEDYGNVVQTFASAIHSELLSLRVFLAETQKHYQRFKKGYEQRMASLIELQATLSGKLEIVHVILTFLNERRFYEAKPNNTELACVYATDILSSLYMSVCELELSGDSSNSRPFLRLLERSIRPFLLNVEFWLSGLPLDSESEFLIQATSNIDLFSSAFWSDGYHIRTEIVDHAGDGSNSASTLQISPCFLTEVSLKQIIYTGKAVRITQALLATEVVPLPQIESFASSVFCKIFQKRASIGPGTSRLENYFQRNFPRYEIILSHQYPLSSTPSSIHSIVEAPDPTNYSATVGFKWRMEFELAKSIEEQYLAANSLLKSMLFTQSRLLWHLKGMTEFYFMMQGEVMHTFSATIFSKMERKRPWYDSYVLGSTFSNIASLGNWSHAKFVKIRVNDQHRQKTSQTHLPGLKVQILDNIEFEYLVKIAKHAMELPSFLKSRPRPSSELGLFWKLRLRFLSAMNDLWSYFMMTVLDVQIQKFQAEIEEQCDLDDIIKLSQRFINLCYERCFLKERTIPLYRSLVTMLNLALKFSALFSAFIHEQELEFRQPGGLQSIPLPTQGHVGRSGRRVSFNTMQSAPSWRSNFHGGDEGISTDSDSEFLDQQHDGDEEKSVGGADKRKMSPPHIFFGDEGDADYLDNDEDIEMDAGEGTSRVKRPKVGTEFSGLAQPGLTYQMYHPQDHKPSSRKNWNHQSSFKQQLQEIEHEFNRSREFLAKSLRVVVSSNAARGYATRSGDVADLRQGEGDSSYLDGLILALSS
ncbi:hypothetical protein BGZ54_003783 [Gamsiella multidivaricata]|nr:hypothetical protein BGZ54_003783 [Gamsiella multidivaricata]